MTDYTELKRLAEKSKDSWVNGKWHTRPTLDIGVDEDDSAYITAASPDVVLSMIAEIELLEHRWSEWKESLNSVMEQRNLLRTQNQALAEALEELTDCGAEAWGEDRPCVQDGRAALAQAEGWV